jgi:hypothetical protein
MGRLHHLEHFCLRLRVGKGVVVACLCGLMLWVTRSN